MALLPRVRVRGRLRRAWVILLLAVMAISRGPWSTLADEGSPDPADDRSPWLTLTTDAAPFFMAIGSATSQGVSVLKADQARTIFGVTGAGVRLGVISDSFNGSGSTPTLATQIAAGNLPGAGNPNGFTTGVTVVKDDAGTDEGRAMLEIVHDVAPGAQLFFHSAFNNTNPTTSWTGVGTPAPDRSIADAIDGLAAIPGMRVIVDDVGYLTAPRFQDGPAARSANAAFAKGIATFSAAGNSATDATRVMTSVGVGGTVNWGTDGLLLMRAAANSTGRAVLQWGEPYPSVSGSAATSNFRVAVTTPTGATTYFTIDGQAAGQDPYEFIGVTNSGFTPLNVALRVTRLSGTAPVTMQLSTFGSGFTIIDADKTNAPTIYGHAAATGVVGVAASSWGTPSSVESFSSRGPTLILFDADGNPVNETRTTPLLTAPDGGTTTTSGFNPFFGTSAAAPHAAAVAALVMERFDQKGLTYSTRDVYQVLFDSAVDIGAAGLDTASGHGRIDALAAVSAGRIWDGNGSTAGVAGSGTWSRANWTLEAAGDKPTGTFIRGQRAIFGSGTAAQSSYSIVVDGTYDVAGLSFARDTVTLSGGSGTLRLTDPTVDVASGLTATVGVSLAGSGGLVKTGAGELRITGSSGYPGTTTISAGRLVGTTASLTGTISNRATLEFAQAGSGTFSGSLLGSGALLKTGDGTLTLQRGQFSGTTTVSGGRLVVPAATLRGPVVNDAAFEFAQASNGEYASVISGSGSLTKSGTGTLTLSGSSLVPGVTTISAGMLATGGAERLADASTVSISGTGTLRLGGNETIASLLGSGSVNLQSFRLTVAGSGSSSYGGSIFGSGGLAKAGSGILTLTGSNGFLGATTLDAGTLVLSSTGALSPFTTLSIAAGSTLVVDRDVRVFAYTNAGGTITGTGRLLTSATATTGGVLTALADATGTDAYAVGLLKTSTATLVVSGSTSFTGGVVVEQGTVKLDAGGSFAATNVVNVRSGATLDLNGQAQTVSALAGSGSVALGGGTLTVAAATSTTFAGAIDGGALVKSGSSGLNLTGSASVTTAAVTAGLMSINGTLSGSVAVAPGGTLGGAGTIIGAVTVGGTHAPGNSPDVSTIMGDLAYATGAAVVWEISADDTTQGPVGGRVFDQIVVTGDLTFSGSTALVLSFFDQDPNSSWASTVDWGDEFWSSNRAWTIYQVSGSTSGFANLSLQTASWLDSNGVGFDIARANHSFSLALAGNDVMLLYAVPEPGTIGLLASAGICLLAVRSRRRAAHQGLCHSPQAAR